MLLKRLKLKNFLIYEDVDLDLSSIKLASIVGQFASDRRRSNGAGKTAFLESIRYALYDQTRSKFKQDIVRVGTKTSTVELICDIGGKVVRVWRQRLADATSAATLHIDGKPAGDKIKVVNETLQSLIGIDVDLFDSIYFFKQGDHFSFAEANPTDRKNALAKVFRMDALNKCADLAKKRRSDKENELAKAKGAAETLGSQLNSRVPYQTIVEQELAISAELATAKQLDAAYTTLHSENALDAQFLDENYKAFQSEIQDDLNNVSIIHRSIQAVTGKIAEQQVLRQRDDSKAGQLKQLIAADESRITAYDGVDVDAAKSDAAKLVADCEVASRQAIGLFYTAQAELKLLSNRQVNVDAGATCPTCQQFVPAEHVEACAAKARKQAEALTKKVDDGRTAKSLAEQNLQKAKDKLAEIEQVIPIRKNVDFLYDNLREVRSRLKACDEEIDKLTTERNELFARQGEAEARVDKDFVLSYQGAVDKLYLPASRMLRTSALGRQADIRRNIEKLTAEHARLVKELQDAKQQAADYEAAVARCKQIESNYIVYDRLYEIFGRNGIQAIMIENAIGVIETFANDILKQMQTRFVVSLRTTKETKAGDIRESLDIIVFDNGSEKPFENYSGGEKALINIALRLSLSKVISALHGIKMQSLFLDEVLGALDGPNREEVVKILSYLSRSFDQVFVVSHTDEIQDVIDSSIIIERYDSHSEIKLTHGRN